MYKPSSSPALPSRSPSRHGSRPPLASLRLAALGRIVGLGLLLGALSGVVIGTLVGLVFSSLPGGGELLSYGFDSGLIAGGAAGIIVALGAGLITAALIPATLSRRLSVPQTSLMAATLGVLVPLLISVAIFRSTLVAIPAFIAWPLALWACHRTLSSLLFPTGSGATSRQARH